MDLVVTTGPTATSIDKALLKANKRIRHASEDDLLDFWIKAADAFIEKETNRALMEQTIRLRLGRVMPVVQLLRPPLKEIVSITYTTDAEHTVDPADTGQVIVDMLPTITIPALMSSFPTGTDGTMEVIYKAGWATPEAVPAPLRQAALLLASHYVTSREAAFMDMRLMQVEKKIAFGVDELLRNYRVPNTNEPPNGGW